MYQKTREFNDYDDYVFSYTQFHDFSIVADLCKVYINKKMCFYPTFSLSGNTAVDAIVQGQVERNVKENTNAL